MRIYALLITLVILNMGIGQSAYAQEAGSLSDPRDGKVYKTVNINNQLWMGENLAFKLENGCTVYDDVKDYVKTHGYLYTWEAAIQACPSGWHLPSMQDWWYLSGYLGGDAVAGGKMKQGGNSGWKSPNAGATNSSGFTALSSGRGGDKSKEHFGSATFFWTNVDDDDATSWCAALYFDREALLLFPANKKDSYSVRCIKNSDQVEKAVDFW